MQRRLSHNALIMRMCFERRFIRGSWFTRRSSGLFKYTLFFTRIQYLSKTQTGSVKDCQKDDWTSRATARALVVSKSAVELLVDGKGERILSSEIRIQDERSLSLYA